jgi:hypothetical protein
LVLLVKAQKFIKAKKRNPFLSSSAAGSFFWDFDKNRLGLFIARGK